MKKMRLQDDDVMAMARDTELERLDQLNTPLIVLKDGQWQADVMENMRLQDMDIMAAARTKGIKTLNQIKYAILERNGAISIIKAKE